MHQWPCTTIPSSASCHLTYKPKLKGGCELTPHHHAKCLQIVLVFFFVWGVAGMLQAVRMGCHAKAVDLCMTRRPYGVAHGPPLINK